MLACEREEPSCFLSLLAASPTAAVRLSGEYQAEQFSKSQLDADMYGVDILARSLAQQAILNTKS